MTNLETDETVARLMALARKIGTQANIDTINEYPSETTRASFAALESALREALDQGEPVAFIESPHAAIRANPNVRWEPSPHTVTYSIPLFAARKAAP